MDRDDNPANPFGPDEWPSEGLTASGGPDRRPTAFEVAAGRRGAQGCLQTLRAHPPARPVASLRSREQHAASG